MTFHIPERSDLVLIENIKFHVKKKKKDNPSSWNVPWHLHTEILLDTLGWSQAHCCLSNVQVTIVLLSWCEHTSPWAIPACISQASQPYQVTV